MRTGAMQAQSAVEGSGWLIITQPKKMEEQLRRTGSYLFIFKVLKCLVNSEKKNFSCHLTKIAGSESRIRSGSVSQRCGSGSVPKCHESATLFCEKICSLDVLYEDQGVVNCIFLSSCKLFYILVIKILDPDAVPDPH
jgi:hypothetical protein